MGNKQTVIEQKMLWVPYIKTKDLSFFCRFIVQFLFKLRLQCTTQQCNNTKKNSVYTFIV